MIDQITAAFSPASPDLTPLVVASTGLLAGSIPGAVMGFGLGLFVVFMPVEASEAQKVQNHVIFLENFFDELRRRVPVGK